MGKPLINIGVNWPEIPGMARGYCPGREWKTATKSYDPATWIAYLKKLPKGATIIVNDEDGEQDPRTASAADVRKASDRRIELHRTIRRERPDLLNADVCGPCPISDTPGPVWNDQPMLRRWRAGNAVTVPPVLPHLTAMAIELYHCARSQTVGTPAELDDYRRMRDANVAETRRWADGRPVIGVVYLRAKGGARPWGEYLGEAFATAMLEDLAPLVDAVAIWDCQFEPGGKPLSAKPYAADDPVLARVRAFAGAA